MSTFGTTTGGAFEGLNIIVSIESHVGRTVPW